MNEFLTRSVVLINPLRFLRGLPQSQENCNRLYPDPLVCPIFKGMKNKFLLIILSIALLTFGCEKIELGKAFYCHMGTNYKVNNDLSFIINSLNDSRCPENMVCAWQGEVYLNFNINLRGNNFDTVLYLNPTGQPPNAQIGEYDFAIYQAEPITGGTSTSKDITIKMVISK